MQRYIDEYLFCSFQLYFAAVWSPARYTVMGMEPDIALMQFKRDYFLC